jgi:hypothetical protein
MRRKWLTLNHMQIYPAVKGVKVIKQAGGESGLMMGRSMKSVFN